jgi:phosphoribosyl 1,2-cyclic phosphodiesterase
LGYLLSLDVHVLASGSDGNCTVISTGQTTVMIDAGLSGKTILRLLEKVGVGVEEIDAILLTHEHSDHVYGAGILSRRHKIPLCANRNTLACSNIGPVDETITFQTKEKFSLGELEITPLPIPHNAAEPNAYFLTCGESKFLLATDMGRVSNEVFAALKEAELVMIESNHDVQMLINGPYPPALKSEIRSDRGHLSNVDCGRALWATYSETRKVFLAHISKNNNTPELARRTVARTLGRSIDDIDCLREADDIRSMTI